MYAFMQMGFIGQASQHGAQMTRTISQSTHILYAHRLLTHIKISARKEVILYARARGIHT